MFASEDLDYLYICHAVTSWDIYWGKNNNPDRLCSQAAAVVMTFVLTLIFWLLSSAVRYEHVATGPIFKMDVQN